MKIRMSIAAVGVSALLGAGAFVLPAAASGHSESESHTLKFIAVQDKSTMFTQTTGAEQDTDVNTAGKVIGFDMIYFAVSSKTTALNLTLDLTLDTTVGLVETCLPFTLFCVADYVTAPTVVARNSGVGSEQAVRAGAVTPKTVTH